MDVEVRPATESDVPALVELHRPQQEFGGKWFTNPFAGGKQAKYEDLTPAQRWLHGGPWMDPELLRLHLDRIYEAHGVVLAAVRGTSLVGSAELRPSEEPLPIGSYLDATTWAVPGRAKMEVERALLEAAIREARGRDLRALDIAPLHAGGDVARFLPEGFSVFIEHRTVHLESGKRPKPAVYAVQSTGPSYTELREYVALNHTEPPAARMGDLGNDWSAGLLSDLSRPFGAILRVDFAAIGITGRECPWLPEREAEIDLWVPMAALGNLPWLGHAVAAAVDHVAKLHPAARYRTTVRAHQVPLLAKLGFENGGDADPWLRRHLAR